ncbi:ROK family protein [Streptantibioticus rubrisoli]|uniref:ROK family protein n=1 Tax=Streptantibioticus rubrisoli TaxID=1387313 RepID=A0ABT1PAN6_9ACTN|nr:ROK family transcriptional regulator [Streptantibioticus rubrisoli]MCQ4042431.1 ROK family protein [Streptantibioticus rubrisoli]
MNRGNSGANLPVLRGHNAALVLDLLRSATVGGGAGISRLELAERTGLTPQAVSKIVARLRAEGMATEAGRRASTGGKPRTLLRLVPGARYAVGLHLDRDEMTAVLADLTGERVAVRTAPFDLGADPASVLDAVAARVRRLLAGVGGRAVLGAGVAVPGPLDHRSGVLHRVTGFPQWDGFPLRAALADRLGVPVTLDKDTNAAALAVLELPDAPPTGTPPRAQAQTPPRPTRTPTASASPPRPPTPTAPARAGDAATPCQPPGPADTPPPDTTATAPPPGTVGTEPPGTTATAPPPGTANSAPPNATAPPRPAGHPTGTHPPAAGGGCQLAAPVASFAYLHLGTGLGAGLVLDGAVYRGPRTGAGEFGHQVVQLDGPPCGCGKRGCLEALCLAALARADIARAARLLGVGAANLVALLDIDRVVLGGRAVLAARESFAEGVAAVLAEQSVHPVPVTVAPADRSTVADGAAWMVLAPVFGR